MDSTITEDLKQEGIARELINRVQNLRKDSGLEVQTYNQIAVAMQSNPKLQARIQSMMN